MIIANHYLFENLKICRAQNGEKCMIGQERCVRYTCNWSYCTWLIQASSHKLGYFSEVSTSTNHLLDNLWIFSYFLCIDFPTELPTQQINLCRYLEHRFLFCFVCFLDFFFSFCFCFFYKYHTVLLLDWNNEEAR